MYDEYDDDYYIGKWPEDSEVDWDDIQANEPLGYLDFDQTNQIWAPIYICPCCGMSEYDMGRAAYYLGLTLGEYATKEFQCGWLDSQWAKNMAV